MVVDCSALLAVLFDEPDKPALSAALVSADDPVISAATLVEASIVVMGRLGAPGIDELDTLIERSNLRCVAVDRSQALIARDASARYGKGRSRAGLNFGDCFAYALARQTKRPLLVKGADFALTDVKPAAP